MSSRGFKIKKETYIDDLAELGLEARFDRLQSVGLVFVTQRALQFTSPPCAYEPPVAPGVELARVVQRQHEVRPRGELLDADPVVVEVVDHHGGRLRGAVARAERSAVQEGPAVAADEDVAFLAERGGVAVAADRLDDLEVLERRDELRRFYLEG